MLAEEEKSKKRQKAEEDVRKAEETLERVKKRLKEAERAEAVEKRKKENHSKYVAGGIVMRYLPNMLRYDEEELNRIIAGALKSEQAQSIIKLVEREGSEKKTPETAIIKNEREGGDESI